MLLHRDTMWVLFLKPWKQNEKKKQQNLFFHSAPSWRHYCPGWGWRVGALKNNNKQTQKNKYKIQPQRGLKEEQGDTTDSGTTFFQPRRLLSSCRSSEKSQSVCRQHFEASVSLLNVVGQSGLDYKEEVEEVEEGWEEKGTEGERQGDREEVEVCAKMEQLLQVTFHESARGQFVFFHFYSLSSLVSPYAIVMDPPPRKSLFSCNAKDLQTSKSLSVLRLLTLPSHYVSPLTRMN